MIGILGEEASHSITNIQATELKVHKLPSCLNWPVAIHHPAKTLFYFSSFLTVKSPPYVSVFSLTGFPFSDLTGPDKVTNAHSTPSTL